MVHSLGFGVFCSVGWVRWEKQGESWPRKQAKVLIMVTNEGLSCYELGVYITSFLLWEDSHDECLFDYLCIERHTRCAAHMVGPNLFVLC